MPRIEKTVFLSYRRADLGWARAIYQCLQERGYDVFFDFTGLASGKFESVIIDNIKARAHFLVLLTARALERCNQPDDWLRREIETAIATQRDIVPLMFEGFDFESPEIAKQLNGKLAELKDYNGLPIPRAYFDDAMERLCDKYLKVAVDAKLHPASSYAREAAKKEQLSATAALDRTPNGRTSAKATRGVMERGLAEQGALQRRAAEAQRKAAGEVQRKAAEEA